MDNLRTTKPSNNSIDVQRRISGKPIVHRHKISAPEFESFSKATTPKTEVCSSLIYNEIEFVLQQIDPTFKLFAIEESPLSRILKCIKQATAVIQSRLSTEESGDCNLKSVCEHCGNSSRALAKQEQIITEEKTRLRNKLKSLEKAKLIHAEKVREERKILVSNRIQLETLMAKFSAGQVTKSLTSQTPTLGIEKINQFEINIYPKISKTKCTALSMESFPIYNIEYNFDFTSLIDEVNSQICFYNEEISLKENSLIEREKQVSLQEQQVKKVLNDIELMNLSLNASKKELQDLKSDIFPVLEFQSDLVKELIFELHCKKEDIEMYLKNLKNSRFSVNEKGALQNIEKLQEEAEIKYKENCEFADYLFEMERKLDLHYDKKNKELKENTDQLTKLQENIDYSIELINNKEKELLIYSESLRQGAKSYHRTGTLAMSSNPSDPLGQPTDKRKSKIIRAETVLFTA